MTPPAPPQPPLDYRPPGKDKAPPIGDLGAPQPVFDMVGGPNLRLRDNLIQLGAVIAGAILGIPIGMIFMTDKMAGALLGGFIGLVAGLFLSGIGLGIYRFITGVQRVSGKQGGTPPPQKP